MRRPCESRFIWTASRSTCRSTMPPRRKSDLCREGMPTMESSSTAQSCAFQNIRRSSKSEITSIDANLAQQPEIAQHLACAEDYRSQGVIGDRNRQASLLTDAFIEILQERAAAGEDDAAVAYVRGELGRSTFQG